MKRFYDRADHVALDEENGFGVTLDGRRVKTPGKRALVLPTQGLAAAVAAEWGAQEEQILPTTMPMMTLSVSAIDRIAPQIDEIVKDLSGYAGSDTLCYRGTDPAALVEVQSAKWDPLLAQAQGEFGLRFVLAGGIMHQKQPVETLQRAQDLLAVADAMQLSALHTLISITGSFVLGLFVWRGLVDAASAFDLGLLEELYQAQVWGTDHEAEDRRDRLKNDMLSAERFLTLLSA